MAVGTPPLLAGRASRDIMLEMERLHLSDNPRRKTIELFSKLFAVSLVRMLVVSAEEALRCCHEIANK